MDELDRVVLAVAREDEHATDGTRMIAAIASRRAGRAINRKRCQRLMREHQLLQPVRSEDRRRRPGYFQVTRPDELWHLDMTSVWVAEHGWTYLNAAIDCCTREIVGWALNLSRGGLRAIIEEPVQLGAELQVAVGEGGKRRPGRIVWIQDEPDGAIVGVSFLDDTDSQPPPAQPAPTGREPG